MKKVLSLILLLGTLAGTASAAPYYVTAPASGELTPYDWQPVYSIHGIYNWTHDEDMPDTAGARLNFSLYSNAYSTTRHQFTISVGYETGSRNYEYPYAVDNEIYTDKTKVELTKIPLTLGYDLNIALSDHVLLDLGVRGGYTFGSVSTQDDDLLWRIKSTTHTGGFIYTLTAGLKVQCSEDIYVKLAYEFTRTFLSENLPSHCTFNQHGIVFGVGCTF